MELEQYLPSISNLRWAQREVGYIAKLDQLINNFDNAMAQDLVADIVADYSDYLNKLSTHVNRPVTLREEATAYYERATDADVHQDLVYLRAVMIAIGAVKCGLISSIYDVIDELNI